MNFQSLAFLLCLLCATVHAWEIPAFLTDGLPAIEGLVSSATYSDEVMTVATSEEPFQRRVEKQRRPWHRAATAARHRSGAREKGHAR